MMLVFTSLDMLTVTSERHEGCRINLIRELVDFKFCCLWNFCRSRSRSRSPLPPVSEFSQLRLNIIILHAFVVTESDDVLLGFLLF